jgi:peptidoglycan-N-acetylglucosamine deacetylase
VFVRGYFEGVPALALTFDDGPDPTWTAKLLDLLAGHRARATFFPIATRAAAHPDLIARMLREGHAIGLHCGVHVRHGERNLEWLRGDTRSAVGQLARLGVRPTFWRTPWGVTAPWSAQVAQEYGLQLLGWTVDTHDWRGDLAEDMFLASRPALEDGAVVLAHDGIGPGARRVSSEQTLGYVELVADFARRRGLKLEALT